MNMKACSVTISKWKTAQPKCNGNCQMPSNAIRINISSPANKLPNNRSDRDKGFANNETDSRIKLKEMINGAAISPSPFVGGLIGCKVSSLINPLKPLCFIV